MSRRLVSAVSGLLALAACARIAGLESSDPPQTTLPAQSPATSAEAGPTLETSSGARFPASLSLTSKCGGSTDTTFTIENITDGDLSYEITSAADAGAATITVRTDDDAEVPSVKGTIPASKAHPITLHIVGTTAGTTDTSLNLTTTSNRGTTTSTIQIIVTVGGSQLVLLPSTIDFGQVRQNTAPPDQTLTLQNPGSDPVVIQGWTPGGTGTDFSMNTTTVTVPANGTATTSAKFSAGTAGDPLSQTFQAQTAAPLCGDAPTLTLKGQRVNQSVTINPGTLPFGDIDCNTVPGGTLPATISNFATNPVGVTLASAGAFNVSPTTLTVPAFAAGTPGQMTVTVGPKAVGATLGGHTDTISFTVTGADTTSLSLGASYNVRGAILDVEPQALNNFGAGTTKSFSVTNLGNDEIWFAASLSNGAFDFPNGNSTELFAAPGSLFNPNAASVDVRLNTASPGTYNGLVTVRRISGPFNSHSAVLCNQPNQVQLSGKIN